MSSYQACQNAEIESMDAFPRVADAYSRLRLML